MSGMLVDRGIDGCNTAGSSLSLGSNLRTPSERHMVGKIVEARRWVRGVLLALPASLLCACGTNEPSRIIRSASATEDAGQAPTDDGGRGVGVESFTPLCSEVPLTAAGVAPTKNGACTPDDTQLCYKTCGPSSIGFKSETCMGSNYAEMSGCSFPSGDYSCYKIPAVIDPSCPATAPQAGQPCEVPECTPCNAGGNYFDSQGASKTGYCVCLPPNDDGMRSWTCGSSTAWPCPDGQGC
jgi:hypothetical protein